VVTASGMVVGTPRYISPEQALGRTVDHRSDIYSLGATFYELVTRQTPFDGDTAMDIMLKHINAPLVPPYMMNPGIPGDVNEIICRMMAKDPKERYQEYEPLIRDLEAAKIHRLAKERRHDHEDLGSATSQTTDNAVHGSTRHSPYLSEGLVNVDLTEIPAAKGGKSRAGLLVLAALAVLAVVGGWLAMSRPDHDAEGSGSWLGQRLRTFMTQQSATPTPSAADLATQDKAMVNLTLERMQATVQQIMDYRKRPQNTGAFPTIRQLRGESVVTFELTQDAWSNDFVVSSANGGTLISAGRDRVEGTQDDFVLSLSGTVIKAPTALSEEDFAPKKK
jgi:serine/threonine protein kinase